MSEYTVVATDLGKSFGRRLIFKNINFSLSSKNVIGVSGHNGSGKSTLMKIIAGIISPTRGKIIHTYNDKEIIPEKIHERLGFVSPYLTLYDEFTAEENLGIFSKIRNVPYNEEKINRLLENFLLFDRKNDEVKTYSSGMKQRLKFIFSLMHNPDLIILDEPTSNLDTAGKKIVYDIIKEESKNSLVLIASNEESDLELCNRLIKLEDFKS